MQGGEHVDDETLEDTRVKGNARDLKNHTIDLVDPNTIPDLKYIAEVMFASGYDAECCEAYISLRKDALEECLRVLEVGNLSINDVLRMDWNSFVSETEKWVRAAETFIRVHLASEKCLSEKVFGVSVSVGKNCFIEASKNLVLQLLSFGEAVANRQHLPEQVFLTLYMYDGFANFLPYIDVFFSEQAGSCVSTVAHEIARILGDSVRRSLYAFENAVRTNELSTPVTTGSVHSLTNDVMNFLKSLTYYSNNLNFLLKDSGGDHLPSSSNMNTVVENDNETSYSSCGSPIAQYLHSVISTLESNLESKSQLYTDVSLRHFFLMNNIFYMAQKGKDSEFQPFMGEDWIIKQNEKFLQHAVDYERACWTPVLSFLRYEDLVDVDILPSVSFPITILKAKILCFNLAFEEIYRTQTTWLIPDAKFRGDRRISISLELLQAYGTFLGMFFNELTDERYRNKYIKYSVEDLRVFLQELFEGSPGSWCKSPSPKEDFSQILVETRQPFEQWYFPFDTESDDISSWDLIASVHDGPSEATSLLLQRSQKFGLKDYIIGSVNPKAIPDLKCIINFMFSSGYVAECYEAYIRSRKDALKECYSLLRVENLSINNVLRMDSSSLNSKILKWVRTAKIYTYVYLSEKSLAGKVFGVSRAVSQTYFIEDPQTWIIWNLNFCIEVAIRNHSPEKIFLLMCMYDVLSNLIPIIDVLFSDEAGSYVRNEAHGVLSGLGESVMRTLDQFRNAVKTNVSSIQFTESGVHHLTMYVMKYLKTLTYYSDILNIILHEGRDDHLQSSLNTNTATEVDGKCSSCSSSPVSQWLQSTVSILESNLKRKSLVYTNVSLQHLFLMNNLCHMVQKVKDSELEPLLGESWMRKQNGKLLQHALSYERNSWGPVLSLLREEGIWNPRSNSISKAILKERILGFNLAFEDIYRSQKMWLIGNAQLRDFLRISISSKVFPAYYSFLQRFSSQPEGRYIKYSAEDLAESILDLFEGSPKPLHRSHRR